MSVNETQVAGTHYRAKVQHWDYVLQALQGRYLEGNITKYVLRHRKKNGLQDLEKALQYLAKLHESLKSGVVTPLNKPNMNFDMHRFVVENGLNSMEAFIVKRLAYWYQPEHLDEAEKAIRVLAKDYAEHEARMNAIKAGGLRLEDTGKPGKGYTNQG